MTSHSSTPQSSGATLRIPPSTPARQLRTRSPQQPSPGFVFTGSDSRRRLTNNSENPSSRPTNTPARHSSATSPTTESPKVAAVSKKRVREDAGTATSSNSQTVSKKKKTAPKKQGKDQEDVPVVIDVDQDSSGDENEDSRPGRKGDVVELLRYFGNPKHKDGEVCHFRLCF
ncbi:uncharacterized protein MELLADRAFT_94846 [Melampsora larici-populina 98AG31]|uniref:Uncharacterized protein n=1 Tax=Melampsora larici-populina (strain 98AG31 / pathotype 3-4-7) TaxID=747676 RepID=F4S852_MELLP|nr:uncharacterized protein MELLADRAFT_94846 [Melampsora larici-populina 98AG31]EGF99179.1 hypothetical protein MELLADRAFT_94846 [Melampsora larici-populina 98AG31]